MSTIPWKLHAAETKHLDRQMRSWEASRQLRNNHAEEKRPAVEEFIYLSREVGAGGRDVAAELSRRLEWPVFDQELLHLMAGDDQIRERLYASMDERDVGWFEESLRAWTNPALGRNDYFHRLTATILSLARQAHAIFLGRGAGLILPREIGVRVRIIAPASMRLRRFAQVTHRPPDEAKEDLDRFDRQRGDFVWSHFHKNIEDPLLYDLTINMAKVTPAKAAEAILACRGNGNG